MNTSAIEAGDLLSIMIKESRFRFAPVISAFVLFATDPIV